MKLYITLIHVIIQYEVTHKFGGRWVKFDRSFLQKKFRIVKQKHITIIAILLLRQLEKKGKEKQKSIKSSTEIVRFVWRKDTSNETNDICKNLSSKLLSGCLFFHSSHRKLSFHGIWKKAMSDSDNRKQMKSTSTSFYFIRVSFLLHCVDTIFCSGSIKRNLVKPSKLMVHQIKYNTSFMLFGHQLWNLQCQCLNNLQGNH